MSTMVYDSPITNFARGGRALAPAAVAAVFCLAAAAAPCALAADDGGAVERARQALSEPIEFPWYDEQQDDVRRIDVAPPPPPPKAGDWEWEPSRTAPAANQGSAVRSGFLQLMQILAYTVLILLVAAIVFFPDPAPSCGTRPAAAVPSKRCW